MEETAERQGASRLLIVEDDVSQLRTLVAVMQAEGFDAIGCSTAAEALEHFDWEDIAVAVVDLRLPDLDGTRLLEKLRALAHEVPIIINTAYSSYESARDAVNLGAFAYVEKAGDPDELVRHVHRAFRERLRRYAEDLESAVAERTRELQETNEALRREVAERKRAEVELRNSREQMRALAARLLAVREEERKEVAREIHEELAQGLTLLAFDIAWVAGRLSETGGETQGQAVAERLEHMSALTDSTLQSVRRIMSALRPAALDDLGLVAAIEWEASTFEERTGVPCELALPEEDIELEAECATAMFRICQEALTNVARHADAEHAHIRLRSDGGCIRMEIQDDGKGITDEESGDPTSFGLLGMRERALAFGGSVEVAGHPGEGTTVAVRIPLDRGQHGGSR